MKFPGCNQANRRVVVARHRAKRCRVSSCLYCISYKYTVKRNLLLIQNIFWIYNTVMKTKKVRRGRPPKGSGESKSISVLLRMEPREKEGFAEAAALAGVPLAIWMRERLRASARNELAGAGKEVPFLS